MSRAERDFWAIGAGRAWATLSFYPSANRWEASLANTSTSHEGRQWVGITAKDACERALLDHKVEEQHRAAVPAKHKRQAGAA